MQVGSAVVLALGVMINLYLMEDKLIAIISALLLSNIFASLWLPVLFAKGYRCKIQLAEVLETLKYAVPFMFGYLSYFVLNKISILLLQRHAPLEEIASYGLAQQLAMMIPIIGAALGKAIQPSIFSATDDRKALLLISQYSGILLQVLASVAVLLIIFAPEVIQIVASSAYKSTATMFRLLLLGSFLFSLTLVSDTTLLYFKKPIYSTLSTVIGAVCATSLGYILIPLYKGYGATMAIVSAYSVSTLVSFMLAYGFNRHLKTAPFALASLAMVGAVVFVESLDYLDVDLSLKLVIKIAIAGLIFKFAWKNLTNLKENLGI
jgi:O-antigen/teichoic acid export membrane protein